MGYCHFSHKGAGTLASEWLRALLAGAVQEIHLPFSCFNFLWFWFIYFNVRDIAQRWAIPSWLCHCSCQLTLLRLLLISSLCHAFLPLSKVRWGWRLSPRSRRWCCAEPWDLPEYFSGDYSHQAAAPSASYTSLKHLQRSQKYTCGSIQLPLSLMECFPLISNETWMTNISAQKACL